MSMKSFLLGLVSGLLAAGLTAMAFVEPQDTKPKSPMAEMKNKVDDLEKRVTDLETVILMDDEDDSKDPKDDKKDAK